jgi:hypothetical protein
VYRGTPAARHPSSSILKKKKSSGARYLSRTKMSNTEYDARRINLTLNPSLNLNPRLNPNQSLNLNQSLNQ